MQISTAPGPRLGLLAQPSPQGISLHIPTKGDERLPGLHRKTLEAPLIEMPRAGRPVCGMPTIGVGDGEPAHKLREFAILARPENKMPVIGHEAIGEKSHLCARQRINEQQLKGVIIWGMIEDVSPTISTVKNVIDDTALAGS